MDDVTLRQLRYFDALARHRHFGQAADASAVSQPALSMQIKALEESLGTALVERGDRQVRLTGFGEDVLARVREILRGVDELGALARATRDRMAGRLRIGVIPTIAPYLLPRIVADLSARYPDLDIRVRETLTLRLVAELHEGQLDAALVALPISEPGLTELELFQEQFVLVRPGADANLPVPPVEALREMRLLLLEEGHCFRDQALALCNLHATRPREMLDGSSLSTLVQMVGAGIGVTVIPEMAIPIETRSADVSVVAFGDPHPRRRIGMVWRQSSPLAAQLRDIAVHVAEVAGRGDKAG